MKNSTCRPQPAQEPAENIDQTYRWKEEIMDYIQFPECPAPRMLDCFGSLLKLTCCCTSWTTTPSPLRCYARTDGHSQWRWYQWNISPNWWISTSVELMICRTVGVQQENASNRFAFNYVRTELTTVGNNMIDCRLPDTLMLILWLIFTHIMGQSRTKLSSITSRNKYYVPFSVCFMLK